MTPIRVRFHPGARHPIIIETEDGPVGLTIPEATDFGLDLIRTIRAAQVHVETTMYRHIPIKEVRNERTRQTA